MRLVLVAAAITRIETRWLWTRRRMSLGRRRGWSLTCLNFGALLRLSRLALLGLCLDLGALLGLGSLALLGLCLHLRTLLGLGSLPLQRPRLDLRPVLGLLSLALLGLGLRTLLNLGGLPHLRPGGLLLCALLRLRDLSLLRLFPALARLLLLPLSHVRLRALLGPRIHLGLALPRLLIGGAISLLAGAGLCFPGDRHLARLYLLLARHVLLLT